MPAPIFYGLNALETSTVTATSTEANRPISRLSDRFIGPQWEGAGPVVWDQGGSPIQFDAVLGAPGHNLSGATLTVKTDDNSGFTTPTTLGSVVATAAAFRVPCTGTVERYSRLEISGGPTVVELAELFASVGVTAPRAPLLETSHNRLGKFVGHETETGVWMATIIADPHWSATWRLLKFSRTLRDSFLDFFTAIGGGGRPFFVLDDEAPTVRFVRWVNPDTAFAGLLPTEYEGTCQLREVTG